MSQRGILFTTLAWEDANGDEISADVRVIYGRDKGYRGDLTSPPEEASVWIDEILPADKSIAIPERFFEDDDLIAECMEDWADDEIAAAEWREQSRRDRLMEGF